MKQGFSLIEMIVSVLIILLLTAFGIAQYNTYNEKERVRQAFLTLRTDLRLVQTKADSAVKPEACGDTVFEGYEVVISATSYTTTPLCGSVENEPTAVNLPSGVTFSPDSLTFTYYPMMRGTSLSAPVTLTLVSLNSYELSLTIAPSGAISINE